MRESWAKAKEGEPTCVADTYGPEHLCRLLGMFPLPSISRLSEWILTRHCPKVSLEELIAQTNMDHQSVARLREELIKFTTWLAKNASKYFAEQYETPSQEYAEKTKF